MAPTETTSTEAAACGATLDQTIEEAITDYTERVRNDRPYEDTVGPDELRNRYKNK
jgi:hypothetical protein